MLKNPYVGKNLRDHLRPESRSLILGLRYSLQNRAIWSGQGHYMVTPQWAEMGLCIPIQMFFPWHGLWHGLDSENEAGCAFLFHFNDHLDTVKLSDWVLEPDPPFTSCDLGQVIQSVSVFPPVKWEWPHMLHRVIVGITWVHVCKALSSVLIPAGYHHHHHPLFQMVSDL